MQQFIDTTNEKIWAFDDDVVVTQNNGAYGFTCANGSELATPPTLQPYTPPTQTSAQALVAAQSAQCDLIDGAYAEAVQQTLSYKTSGGVTKDFDADSTSQTILMQATQGYSIAGSVPSGFYWVSADNVQVPFTLADLQGLYAAMLAQGWTAFQKRQALKEQINAAASVADVEAIVWSAPGS